MNTTQNQPTDGPAPTRTMRDRPTANPGGMECEECGSIFVGDESHALCGICAAAPALPKGEEPAEISALDQHWWVTHRADIIGALADRGLKIMSNATRVWLAQADDARALPEPAETSETIPDAYDRLLASNAVDTKDWMRGWNDCRDFARAAIDAYRQRARGV